MNANPYVGPILYIIHAPAPEKVLQYAKENSFQFLKKANEAKILKALNAAGLRKIPVVYAGSTAREEIEQKISKVKNPPRIIWVRDLTASTGLLLRRKLAREGITPTKVSCMGTLRDKCVLEGARAMKRAFPTATVYSIEGTHSIFRQVDRKFRKEMREKMKLSGILKSKKLTAKHFVR